MEAKKKEIIRKIANKLNGISVEDARYIQGYVDAKTESKDKKSA